MVADARAFVSISMHGIDSSEGGTPLPLVLEALPESADVPRGELLEWIREERDWLENRLHVHGAILFRGFKCLQSADDFQAVMQAVSEQLLDYAGGNTPSM